MKYLFIGVLILAILSGGAAWYLKLTQDQRQGFLGNTLDHLGIKRKEREYSQYRKQMARFFDEQQQDMLDDLHDQQQFLEESREHIRSMSEMAQERMDANNADVLRLKQVMEDLQEQNRLMIERGRQIVEFNKQQQALRQGVFETYEMDNIDNYLVKQRLNTQMDALLRNRQDIFNQANKDNQLMQQQLTVLTQQMNVLRQPVNSPAFINDDQQNKLKEQAQSLMGQIEYQQDQMRLKQHDNQIVVEHTIDQMRDFLKLQDQKTANTKDLLEERKRTLQERTKDQLEQLKSFRESQSQR